MGRGHGNQFYGKFGKSFIRRDGILKRIEISQCRRTR